jgi:hypothetical protein
VTVLPAALADVRFASNSRRGLTVVVLVDADEVLAQAMSNTSMLNEAMTARNLVFIGEPPPLLDSASAHEWGFLVAVAGSPTLVSAW